MPISTRRHPRSPDRSRRSGRDLAHVAPASSPDVGARGCHRARRARARREREGYRRGVPELRPGAVLRGGRRLRRPLRVVPAALRRPRLHHPAVPGLPRSARDALGRAARGAGARAGHAPARVDPDRQPAALAPHQDGPRDGGDRGAERGAHGGRQLVERPDPPGGRRAVPARLLRPAGRRPGRLRDVRGRARDRRSAPSCGERSPPWDSPCSPTARSALP